MPRQVSDDPRRSVAALIHTIGLRVPTSLAEAQAAAHIDGYLRRSGLRVSADTFRAPVNAGYGTTMLALLGLVAAVVSYWVPPATMLLALVGLGLATVLLMRRRPLFARWGDSQNVVATSSAEKHLRWRVVLLARLDSPTVEGQLRTLVSTGRVAVWGCAGALVVITLLATLRLLEPQSFWLYLQALPAAYLLLVLLVGVLPEHHVNNVAGTGALAVLLRAAKQLSDLRQIELWVIALGATNSSIGISDLLARYPFPQGETLVLALDQLDAGRLVYVTRERGLRTQQPDPYLRTLAADADAADPSIDAEPRLADRVPAFVSPLLARNYRTLTFTSSQSVPRPDDRTRAPSTSSDALDTLDRQLIDQATRLVVSMVRSLDASSHPHTSSISRRSSPDT